MNFWLALITLAASAVVLVALPFLRSRKQDGGEASGLDIYTQQLRELEGELASGEVDPATATAERAAIERRILAEAPASAPPTLAPRTDRITAIAVSVVVVLGGVGLYAATGEPAIPDSPHTAMPGMAPVAAAATPGRPPLPDVDTMITRLAERMKSQPDNADGWRMLGWSYFETKHYSEAVAAYAHAVKLKPENAAYRAAYDEAKARAAAPGTGTGVGPGPADIQAAQAMAPQDRQAMIRKMVEGLDKRLRQNPADPEAWVRLIRSRKVLGEPDKAREALSRALVAFAADDATKQKIATAAGALGVTAN